MKRSFALAVVALMLIALLASCKRDDNTIRLTTTSETTTALSTTQLSKELSEFAFSKGTIVEATMLSNTQQSEATTKEISEFVFPKETPDVIRHNSEAVYNAISAEDIELSPYFQDNSLYAFKQLENFGVGEIVDIQKGHGNYHLYLEDNNGIRYSVQFTRDGGLTQLNKQETDGTWALIYDAYMLAEYVD